MNKCPICGKEKELTATVTINRDDCSERDDIVYYSDVVHELQEEINFHRTECVISKRICNDCYNNKKYLK